MWSWSTLTDSFLSITSAQDEPAFGQGGSRTLAESTIKPAKLIGAGKWATSQQDVGPSEKSVLDHLGIDFHTCGPHERNAHGSSTQALVPVKGWSTSMVQLSLNNCQSPEFSLVYWRLCWASVEVPSWRGCKTCAPSVWLRNRLILPLAIATQVKGSTS